MNFKKATSSTSNDQTLVNLIYLQERSNSSISWANEFWQLETYFFYCIVLF
jgi:hypothetical protein